ncbi:dUTP diphosphatase [Oceanobacillus sojae]|uniref:dUTP diphosphatase n=1 Tax=Oceanobacillus sojae TaxID=582851 RepID=UPI0036424BEB
MNLQKLFEIQAKLDEHIVKEKGLEGQNLLDEKILALQVEIGELANEWRGFKFWSENQEPKPPVHNWDVSEDGLTQEWLPEWGYESYPLLEEYVDCLHFILSIGLELGITIDDVSEMGDYTEETTTKTFISIYGDIESIINDLETDIFNKFVKEDYATLLVRFIGLGELQLGFTWEQIEQAYLEKNKINHERQQNGY